MKNLMILMIVKALGVNFPVLRELGFYMQKIITLVVPRGETKNVISILSSYGCIKLDEFAKQKQIREAFCETHSAFIIFPYKYSQRCNKILDLVFSILKAGEVDGKILDALPIFITEDNVIQDNEDQMFLIYCEKEEFSQIKIPMENVVPEAKNLPLIEDKIKNYIIKAESKEEKILIAAICFLYPMIEEYQDYKFEKFIEMAYEMVQVDEDVRDTQDLKEYFIESFLNWQQLNQFSGVYELHSYKKDISDKKVILYDQDYLYISEEMFKRICKPILEIIPISVMKTYLKEEGILLTNNNSLKGYTVKISIRSKENGDITRVRRMKFDRAKLHRDGDMDIIDICKAREGRKNDE